MKKIIYILSLSLAFSISAQSVSFANSNNLFESDEIFFNEVSGIEESPFDFNTKEFLPEYFDPYKGMIIDESYLLASTEIAFEFNTVEYLPENFDAYRGMIVDESSLLIEEPISFDFNTQDYLPANFDAYKGMIAIEPNELMNEPISFDFNINDYLPVNFNPYAGMNDQMKSFIEMC